MSRRFIIEPLSALHDRKGFSCGVVALDWYLQEQASQDIRKRAAQCYIALEAESRRVAGYYTLSAGGIALVDLPREIARRLPRYPLIPVARVGRLAIHSDFKKQRLGGALVWDAADRALRAEMGIFALAVDAKDEAAAAFYRHLGFTPLGSHALQLFIPLETFRRQAAPQ